jgi:hypothetical protein
MHTPFIAHGILKNAIQKNAGGGRLHFFVFSSFS